MNQWESAIRLFERRDHGDPPPRDAILFTGSSTIGQWATLATDFPFTPVINRGFGGSQMSDLVEYAPRVIVPYTPRLLVVYSGDNDLANGKQPKDVARDVEQVTTLTWEALPDLPVVLIAVKPSPSRWHMASEQRATNALMKAYADQDDRCTFIDFFDDMLGQDGSPRPDLYVEDRLHMSPEGYRLWSRRLAPHLQRLWGQATRARGPVPS